MKSEDCLCKGSGFVKYASNGDGILTNLEMMDAILVKNKVMSELVAPLEIDL